MLANLQRRLGGLEKAVELLKSKAIEQECTCRGVGKWFQVTRYHNGEELEQILAVPCAVHGIRAPGFILWTAHWCALTEPDRHFCNCPPSFYRDSQSGKIPLPIDLAYRRKRLDEEMERQYRERQQRKPEDSEKEFKESQAKVTAVLAAFEARVAAAQRGANGN